MKTIALLGSTGSIGVSTLDVVAASPERFRVAAMAAGRNVEVLASQVRRFRPELVAVSGPAEVANFRKSVPDFRGDVLCGEEGRVACATHPGCDTVVAALVGAVGLASAHAAVAAGRRLALANKETMVVAGDLISRTARASGAEIVPIDSEHSAIHQALRAGLPGEVRRLLLTGSGGPFRTRDLATFGAITIEDALRHPTWKMGPKITIDSATMMNKGLEILEAHFLFGVAPDRIEVLLHPQSLIHSMVEFRDGSLVAQLARNDMRFPIAYALGYPERFENPFGTLELAGSKFEFFEPEAARYPAIALARRALAEGGAAPAILNAANEIAVAAFLAGRIRFPSIVRIVEDTLAAHGPEPAPASIEEAVAIDARARRLAEEGALKHSGVMA